jgi:16S rRNA (guanine966-N2)-methyltransferase
MAELRIIAGEWRGRKIAVPPAGVRPTADRVREAWMSIVNPALDGARVLDLCAGSGALGLEALSRGAKHCDFVEKDAQVLEVLKKNIATLGAVSRSTVHGQSVEAWSQVLPPSTSHLPSAVWPVAFADPPYSSGLAELLAVRWLTAPFATIFGVEHSATLTLPDAGPGQSVDRRSYGDTTITIYRSGT